MNNTILSALGALDVASLTRAEWIAVGMALKEEGFPCSVWDEWSRPDERYRPGECAEKWKGFKGSDVPVKGGTIVRMAKAHGWQPGGEDAALDWEDVLEFDGSDEPPVARPPAQELIDYLATLFEPEDRVAYVTSDVWQDESGKWVPGKGVYDRTAGELMESLRARPEDVGATVGDWKPEAGAWIRINPVDGCGVKNENVAKFRYALVESDTLPVADQYALFRRFELPIAALVHSGGKSLHAVVRVDAENAMEYRRRVNFLYDFFEKRGVSIDRQNRNPSRLSRMPGVTRGGRRQYLVGTNLGRASWFDWLDFLEGESDKLPGMVSLAACRENPPAMPEELIAGILRMGHKMLLSGSSKAGKSFMLMELCVAIAEGTSWLGFPCRQGRVLYVNLKIDPASCIERFMRIYKALGLEMKHADDIVIWNLRGYAAPFDRLTPKLIRRVRDRKFSAIVIDPIYKVITGDENSALEMGRFCNQFDRICTETGCATIYCHHHSKGAQGTKRAMDRASGSGVFARDPDAQLDMIQLDLPNELKSRLADSRATAWRLESSLREFENIKPLNLWFEYPLHRVDDEGMLGEMPAQGTFSAGRILNRNAKQTADEEFRRAFRTLATDEGVSVQDICGYLNVTDKTVYSRLRKLDGEFSLKRGRIVRNDAALA